MVQDMSHQEDECSDPSLPIVRMEALFGTNGKRIR